MPGVRDHENCKDTAPYLGIGLSDGSTHLWQACPEYVHASPEKQVGHVPY